MLNKEKTEVVSPKIEENTQKVINNKPKRPRIYGPQKPVYRGKLK